MSSDSNHFFAENNQAMEEGEAMEDEAMEQVDVALFDSLPNQIALEYANGIQLFSRTHSWSNPY